MHMLLMLLTFRVDSPMALRRISRADLPVLPTSKPPNPLANHQSGPVLFSVVVFFFAVEVEKRENDATAHGGGTVPL